MEKPTNTEHETMNVYVTKYCLTRGIFTETVRDAGTREGLVGVYKGNSFVASYELGKTAFLTSEEAVTAARSERDRKIKALLKQIDKLRALDF